LRFEIKPEAKRQQAAAYIQSVANRCALLLRPEGSAGNRPGRKAGRGRGYDDEHRRCGTASKFRTFGAQLCSIPNPGLTAGAILLRPFGPELRDRAHLFMTLCISTSVRTTLQSRPTADFLASNGSGEPSSLINCEKRQQAAALRRHQELEEMARRVSRYVSGRPISKRCPSRIRPRNPSSFRSLSSAEVSWNSPRSRTLLLMCSPR